MSGKLAGSELGSQFLIVTHNKGTMSACNALYGVTMAVRGVSHVVSVELSDVDEFVPEATGSARAASETPRLLGEEPEADGRTLVPFRPSVAVAPERALEPEDEQIEAAS